MKETGIHFCFQAMELCLLCIIFRLRRLKRHKHYCLEWVAAPTGRLFDRTRSSEADRVRIISGIETWPLSHHGFGHGAGICPMTDRVASRPLACPRRPQCCSDGKHISG